MKPSRCSTRGFSSLKRISKASQTWKLPIGIFVCWKIFLHSMRRFYYRFSIEFGDSYILLDVYNIFEKPALVHAHYEANTMRPPSCSRPQPPPTSPTKSSHSLFQGLKRCIRLHPSYLLATIVAILPTKLMSATFLLRISFVIIVGKRDTKKLFVLPSSRNKSNSDYHNKIYQHLPLPFNQKPRHLSLPLRLSPPRVIPIIILRKRSTMLTKGRCFRPMPLKFKLCKMNSNH